MNIYYKILLLLISLSVYGQEFEHLTRKDGLSQSTVYAILQDSKGFMWFGTQDGLNKYDGYDFTHYRHEPNNSNSLTGNFITFIYEDKAKNLWIGINDGGIAKYNRQQDNFTSYQHEPDNPNSLSSDGVLSICEDATGLWITTYDTGLNHFDGKKFTHYRHEPNNPNSLSGDILWRVHTDKKGILWIGTDGAGLNRFDPKTKKFTNYRHDPKNPLSLSSDSITDIFADHNGDLWVGTMDAGLNQLKNNQFIRYINDPQNPDSLNNDTIWAINEDASNNLWIATDGGLDQYLPAQNKFIHNIHDPNNPRSLSNDYVMSINQEQAGALWVGTDGGSLNKFDRYRDKFVHYKNDPQNSNSLSHNTVSSIHVNNNNIHWIGTLGGGLNKLTDGSFTHYKHDPDNPNSLSSDDVWSVHEDQAGIVWIGTFENGLNKFDGQTFTHYLHNPDDLNSLSNDMVRAIYEDRAGNLWLGTRDGLNKFDRKQFTHYKNDPDNPNSLSENSVLSIYEDFGGILWIGTQGGGLNRFDPKTETFTVYQQEQGISHNDVFAVYEDSQHRLWVGTQGGGLNMLDRETQRLTHYRQIDGLANDVTYGILEDGQGYLWISTNGGLSKFNPDKNTFRNYDVLDGLQSDEFREAYYQTNNGQFLFGGINGFNVFHPLKVKDNPYVPPVIITDFKIFNQPVAIGETLTQHISETNNIILNYQQSFFSFEFAALNFLQPEKNKYAYQLEGLEQDWNFIGTRRNAYYTSVPHGTYTFRVRGSNNDGIWNEVGTAIKITVLPPPWQTWWAYTLYLITILAIIISYMRLQKRKLAAKQRELEREQQIAIQLKEADRLKDEFLANTSHELRTPLNGIIGIAESLIDGVAGNVNQQLESNLAIIVSSGRRLTSLVNDILDFSKLKKQEFDLQRTSINMPTIVEIVLALSQPLIEKKNIKLINEISTYLPPLNADENRVQQILHNLVGNAIKFTEKGTVTISAEIVTEGFAVTVADTGIGIPTEKLSRIFEAFEQVDGSTARTYGGTGLGLAVTHQLVSLHGGHICVESRLNQGSKFTFILPITEEQITSEQLPIIAKQAPLDNSNSILPELPDEEVIEETVIELLPSDKHTVLIVDDEPVNRQVLVNHLSLLNYNIIQAESGVQALEILKKIERPDIILLDIMMPVKSGYEVTKEIRKTWAADELPIILLTAKNQIIDMVIGFENGANDYLAKPVFKDELIARIKTHLNVSKLKAETLRLTVENKNRLMQFLESMPIGVIVLNVYGTIFFFNQQAQKILGLEELKTITITTIEELFTDRPFYLTDTKQLYSDDKLPFALALKGEKTSINDVEIHRDNTVVPLEIFGTPIFDEQGDIIYAINIIQDITERKQLEFKQQQVTQKLTNYSETLEQQVAERTGRLRNSEKLLEDAQRMALVGSWIWDIKMGTVSRSTQDCLNCGIAPNDYVPSYEAFVEQVHPDDKEKIDSLLETCIIGEDVAEIEFRVIWSDGQIRNLRSQAELEYDDFETPIYLKGFSQDITESKRIEAQVKQQNIELQTKNTELETLTEQLAEAQKEKLYKLNQAYERFVPKQFLSLLEKNSVIEVNLGDHIEKEITILFSDIRGFTAMSETMSPKKVFDLINMYLGKMEPVIAENKGIIDKYIGDAIMALFPDNADNAVKGGIAMLNMLTQHNELLVRGGLKPMQIGIGLNTGPSMLGTVGGQNRMDGTVISDTVNVASRVEGLTKIYGTPLLITEQTYLKLKDPLQYHVRVIDAVQVKGKTEVVTIYEIYDADSAISLELKDKTRNNFEEGFVLYHWEEYKDAKPLFEKVLKVNKDDIAAQVYLKRCNNKVELE
ncbi:two-component regulator propeller domain-containing protein [Candidatus Halobeggiatoa sp. HSG11]|nr:two-component regulator propeller domain-containing protein [Candidatus Halobeggiatoa sp. HSG11]